MRCYSFPASLITMLLGSTLLLMAPDADATALRLQLVTGDYAPYSGQALTDNGLSSRLIYAALEEVHASAPELHFQSWKEGYENTAELHFDATYPYGWNPQRDKQFLFSEPLHTETLSWYSHKENSAALRGEWHRMKVCLPQGWNTSLYDAVAEKFHLTLVQAPTLEGCLLQLQRRKSDLILLNEVVFNAAIQQLFGNNNQLLALPYYQQQQTLHLMVSRKHPRAEQLITLINKGLEALRKNGRYELLQQNTATAQADSWSHHKRFALHQ